MRKFILMVLIAVFTISVFALTVLFACNKNSTKPSSDSSAGSESIESGESGSPYDDDWYQSGSSSQSSVSIEDEDESEWSNFH